MQKSVLIAGPRFYGYLDNIADSFRSHEYNVHLCALDLRAYRRNNRGPVKRKMEQLNLDIRRCALTHKFDMAVIVKGDSVRSETLQLIKSHIKRIVLFLWDSIDRSFSDLSILKYYDNVLLFEKSDETILRKLGISSTFYGTPVSMRDYYPNGRLDDSVDISFVGSLISERLSTIKAVIDAFPERNIKIYGGHARWISRRRLWMNLTIKNCREYFMNKGLTPPEINALYNSSRICLNIQRSQSEWGCNYRTFEILAAKSFQITSSNPYLESEFRDGGLVTYRDNDDLMEKIRYYLTNSDERRRHAEIGYRHVQQHSYENKFFLFEQ